MGDINDLFDFFDKPPASEHVDKNGGRSESDEESSDFLNAVLDEGDVNDEICETVSKKRKLDDFDDVNVEELSLNHIAVHTVETLEACLHEVALPVGVSYVPLRRSQGTPAKDYAFKLDPFQNEAILCLENDQSVLVSAHTSAGKTVVAEYAVAMSLKAKRRVIYTTPIKALSNQKYREFSEEFSDVGLLTGDCTINSSASCLIMTTEILRSMLYRGSDVMREVNWVIFDEIHYMRDKERGVVWEETIILLPDAVHYVFLSATIPNAAQFAQWICHLHRQPCHVVYTDYRPVPLQQYIFPAGGGGLYMVVDENGNFSDRSFEQAMDALQLSGTASGKSSERGRKGGVKNDGSCYKIVKMIMERNFAPVIAFSFSKKECEAYAMQMAKLDFNTDQEKEAVEVVFNSAMDVLSEEDKKLPQVIAVLPLLKKGIGIHHSGLLPILKETIEIMFAEGLIKALFATETFAMGLNMPARTVLFTNARKFDGKDFRWLTSGEYIQMSGRAGRRGLDERGIVILMLDEKMTPTAAKEIVKGLPDPINSAFHLTYNMILNLIRVDDINPEYMLERSFFQFQNYSVIPELYEKLRKKQDEYDSIQIENEDDVVSYCKIQKQLDLLDEEIHGYVAKPLVLMPFIQPGRLVSVKNKDEDFSWGAVVDAEQVKTESQYEINNVSVIKVLLCVSKESSTGTSNSNLKSPRGSEKGEMVVVPVGINLIKKVSSVRTYLPKDLTTADMRARVQKTIEEVKCRFPQGIPLLHPITDMGIKDKELKHLLDVKEAFERRLLEHPCHKEPSMEKFKKMYSKKASIEAEIKEMRSQLKAAKSILQMEELKRRKRVLRRLKFCTPADIIELKGRVACEISSADELLLTELIFAGTLEELTVPQITALLSCFVFQEKSSEMPKLTEELSGPLRIMQEIARRIAKVSKESKIEVDADSYVESFRPHLMDVVYAWTKGASFCSVCKMTDVFEGSIIRCMRRLEELLRQMCQASKTLGNTEMENKFSEAIKCIKREIVFAGSLYL